MEPETESAIALMVEPIVALLLSLTLSLLIYVLSALIANRLYSAKRKRLESQGVSTVESVAAEDTTDGRQPEQRKEL
jgi:hypothetical protein